MVPDFNKSLNKLLLISTTNVGDLIFHMSPDTFNRVHIWAIAGPREDFEANLIEVRHDKS